jgi:hypothetical protein
MGPGSRDAYQSPRKSLPKFSQQFSGRADWRHAQQLAAGQQIGFPGSGP